MKLHEVMPQAMLFVRGQNAGISHNPLEAITNDDAELCVSAFQNLIEKLCNGTLNDRMLIHDQALDPWIDIHFDERSPLPAGIGSRTNRYAARK